MDKIVNEFVIVIKSTTKHDCVLEFNGKSSFTYPDGTETTAAKEVYMKQVGQTLSRALGVSEVTLYHRYQEGQQLSWVITYKRC